VAASQEFVERMGAALTQAGFPRLPALVFAALLVDDDGRMTAAELATTLAVSAGSVSGAVNYLAQVGMLRKERARGSRKDVYVVDDDAWHTAMMQRDRLHAPMLAALAAGMADLGRRSPAYHRLLLTREFLVFVEQEMDAMAVRWEQRRARLG
jgi:hypothetical protein